MDTSAILGAWYRRLPPDIVPTFWERLATMIAAGQVGCTEEVRRELEKKDDAALGWVRNQAGLLCPLDATVTNIAIQIIADYPQLTRPDSGRDGADPFVIALAQVTGATVVSEEGFATKASKLKIPDVCQALSIPCVDVYGFVRLQGWRF